MCVTAYRELSVTCNQKLHAILSDKGICGKRDFVHRNVGHLVGIMKVEIFILTAHVI